jgi:opacity protein-like surface antigen
VKKLLLAVMVVWPIALPSANAADIPVKAAPAPSVCAASWLQGAYVGVHGGALRFKSNLSDHNALLNDPRNYVQRAIGGHVGGQIGYNWTNCQMLWGVEVDGSWAFAHRNSRVSDFAPPIVDEIRSKLYGFGTARLRTGVVLDSGVLLYVTGGVALIGTRTAWVTNAAGPPLPTVELTRNAWDVGWVAGFGAEWRWSERVSFRSESLFMQTGEHDYTFVIAPFGGIVRSVSDRHTVFLSRISVNYKFDTPVVARY